MWGIDNRGLAAGLARLLPNRVFRTIFFHRVQTGGRLCWLFGEMCKRIYGVTPTCDINTHDIGPGLFIQHGYCTIISPRQVGKNIWVNQGVTIGYTNATETPVIGDNVTIGAGAKVLGDVSVGDNVTVGANAVEIRDVPDNCTVGGAPARIIARRDANGKKVPV